MPRSRDSEPRLGASVSERRCYVTSDQSGGLGFGSAHSAISNFSFFDSSMMIGSFATPATMVFL